MILYNDFIPIVSVILPTFNRAYILERAINSVIDQSFENWELIIIDDGSEDNTYEIVRNYIDSGANIRYLFHKNRKLPYSLNAGITACVGKFITFLGSDDEYQKDHLKLRVAYLSENPKTDFIHGGIEIIGDPYVKNKNNLSETIHIKECAVGGTFFAKREVFEELNGFKNIAYSEDSDFYERVKKAGYVIVKVDYPTYVYFRDTADGICNNI